MNIQKILIYFYFLLHVYIISYTRIRLDVCILIWLIFPILGNSCLRMSFFMPNSAPTLKITSIQSLDTGKTKGQQTQYQTVLCTFIV